MSSDPVAGSALDAPPTAITLTFSEEPEPSLARIRLTDADGAPVPIDPAVPVGGDSRTLSARTPELADGVYTVEWRVVSRVDGHPTTGTFAFGVGVTPEQAELAAGAELTQTPQPSPIEIFARFLLLVGVLALLGAAVAGVFGYAGARRGVPLAAMAWVVTAVGLVLLALAQRASAAVAFGDFIDTYAGRAFLGRALALAVVGLALLVARRARSSTIVTIALAVAAAVVATMIAIHVAAGHAAASSGAARWTTAAAQWSHVVAAAVWIGGLAALLLGVRGAPSPEKGFAVRRFAVVAAGALAIVVVTGISRSVIAIGSWDDLVTTGYGRAILVKVVVVVAIGVLALRNRLHSVPAAATDLGPLRRVSRAELALAVVAIGAAAVLGSLSPPVDVDPLGLTVEGTDASGSVQARLETQWSVPGLNRFELRVTERATGEELDADRATLRFVPLDDPGVSATTLPLERARAAGTWVGAGSNLTFPGRWQVSAVLETASESRVVPLDLQVEGPPLFLSVAAFPDEPVRYSVQLPDNSFIRFTVEPARGDDQRLTVEFFHFFGEPRPVGQVVMTATPEDGRTRQVPLRRVDASSFTGVTDLPAGSTRFAVVGRTPDDTRLYGTYDIEVDASD